MTSPAEPSIEASFAPAYRHIESFVDYTTGETVRRVLVEGEELEFVTHSNEWAMIMTGFERAKRNLEGTGNGQS